MLKKNFTAKTNVPSNSEEKSANSNNIKSKFLVKYNILKLN